MIHTVSFLHFCLSSICFIILTLPAFCFVPSRLSWLQGERGGSEVPEDIAIQNYHNDFRPFNSYRTSMPLPLSRFMNVFNENDQTFEQPQLIKSNFNKRGAERVCGVRLLKKMNTVCNKCIKSPSTAEITKRGGVPGKYLQFYLNILSRGFPMLGINKNCPEFLMS